MPVSRDMPVPAGAQYRALAFKGPVASGSPRELRSVARPNVATTLRLAVTPSRRLLILKRSAPLGGQNLKQKPQARLADAEDSDSEPNSPRAKIHKSAIWRPLAVRLPG